jgi:hypothetical protein
LRRLRLDQNLCRLLLPQGNNRSTDPIGMRGVPNARENGLHACAGRKAEIKEAAAPEAPATLRQRQDFGLLAQGQLRQGRGWFAERFPFGGLAHMEMRCNDRREGVPSIRRLVGDGSGIPVENTKYSSWPQAGAQRLIKHTRRLILDMNNYAKPVTGPIG